MTNSLEIGRTAQVEELTPEGFSPFGTYHNLLDPKGVVIGEPPIQFFPDLLKPCMSKPILGISVCLVHQRPPIVDTTEFHTSTCEGILPLDADILIHVAPPTINGYVPWKMVRIFHIPKGTQVVLHTGVWHHAPILCNEEDVTARVQILLPIATYINDCGVVNLPPEHQTHIVW